MNVVTIICPSLKCRKALQVPEHVRGKLVRCRHCGTTFQVPQAKRPTQTADAAEPKD